MENNKNKKSVKFQGDMLNFCDFIQVFVFIRNHHLNIMPSFVRNSNVCSVLTMSLERNIFFVFCYFDTAHAIICLTFLLVPNELILSDGGCHRILSIFLARISSIISIKET